ncbi:MAG: multidrug efflux SMR transporter [Pseudomonadales bacterium]|nr:multidrug efflux SMR transporter [Pseudomonadales bacterium]
MNWILLILAGCFEIAWAVGLKYSDGFSRLVPATLTLLSMLISIYLLSLALRSIPLGTGYGVWVGIGAIGTALAGVLLFNESWSLLKVGSLLLVIAGIAGLRLASA